MSDQPHRHHRPAPKTTEFFDAYVGGEDPAGLTEAGDLAAQVLVRGADDPRLAQRIIHLADTEGLEAIAQVWSHAPADSLAGCLWRLYVLRQWVHADPHTVAREFEAGRARAQVARVVAGVADPPGPDQLRAMVDEVLGGIATGDFADVLFRASAFARVVAAGRASEHPDQAVPVHAVDPIARLLTLAEQLEAAGHAELAHRLA